MTPASVLPILVIDDQVGVLGSLQQRGFLRNYERLPYSFIFESCWTGTDYDPQIALDVLAREQDVALVLLDLKFGPGDELLGLAILDRLSSRYPSLPVVVMSGADRDVDMLGRCLEGGAVGFVEKHRSPEYLRSAVERALSLVQSHILLGQSGPLRELRRQAARLSPYDQIPVLIVGERGTGKERVARYIHDSGPRRLGPFVAVNCAGVPEGLFEAEFFGAEVGAYTSAIAKHVGYLERADGGTLFLDEVGLLPLALQGKLLRVFQEHVFRRLGSSGPEQTSNFQLVSATNMDPQELVADGGMREDFLDRIAAVTVRTPPLRDCLSDLPLIAGHFLTRLVGDKKSLSQETIGLLQRYRWPGNVRELQRVLQEAVVRSEDSETVDVEHLPGHLRSKEQVEAGTNREPARSSALDDADWARRRLVAELRIAVEAKRHIEQYKGRHWRAEFMRRVYPHCRAQNAKGVSDLVRRLTKGPWGDPGAVVDAELGSMIAELEKRNGDK